MQYDWQSITSLAYTTLIQLDFPAFPVPHNKIKCDGIKIHSYQKYARLTGLTIKEITCDHELDDAFLLGGIRPGISLILYNKEKPDARVKHTLWHEIGHVKCGHKKHGDKEEIEAHFFASQANAPNVLIKAIADRGYMVNNTDFLKQCFGLSESSAQKKLDYLRRYQFEHSNEYDDILLSMFSDFINSKYPPQTALFYGDYLDEVERDRERWNRYG